VRIVPFFTGVSASTTDLVARVSAARTNNPVAVDAALAAIADASRAACKAIAAPADLAQTALIAALSLAGSAIDRLAIATGVDLVPPCVTAARAQMLRFGGTAKTTGAGGGDIGIAVIPGTADVTEVRLALIQAGCQVLQLSVDETGVDLQTNAQ
jgi:phosphomevalonate kinase